MLPSSHALPLRPPGAQAAPFDISFDNRCDGLTLVVGNDLMVGGTHTGCALGTVAGNVTFNFVSFPFDVQAGFGLNLGTFPGAPGATFTLLNLASMQWAHYRTTGGEVPVLLDSGKFSFGPPAPHTAALPTSLSIASPEGTAPGTSRPPD